MRVWGFKSNGGPEVLECIERPTPTPGPGQVLIQVAYAGLNFAEVQHRRGEFGEPDGPDGYDIPGLEVSGTVAAWGEEVDGLALGGAVAAYLPAFGGYAEFVVADAAFVQPIGSLALADAAAVPCVYPTAYGVLTDVGRLRGGDTVLIHAAAGGVGSAAARIARSLGAARIYGTVGSPEKLALARELGYTRLFLRDDFPAALLDVTEGVGVDLVLDPIGGPVRRASLDALAPFGRVVSYGDLGRHGDWTEDAWALWKNSRTLAGYNIGDVARRSPETLGTHLARALSALANGELPYRPPAVLPLDAAPEAHRLLEAGRTDGKTVFAVE